MPPPRPNTTLARAKPTAFDVAPAQGGRTQARRCAHRTTLARPTAGSAASQARRASAHDLRSASDRGRRCSCTAPGCPPAIPAEHPAPARSGRRAFSSAPATPSVRASVRWAANGRSSGAHPSGPSSPSSTPRPALRAPARPRRCRSTAPAAGCGFGNAPPPRELDAERRHSPRRGGQGRGQLAAAARPASRRGNGASGAARRLGPSAAARARTSIGAPATAPSAARRPRERRRATGTATKSRLVPGGSSAGRTKARRPPSPASGSRPLAGHRPSSAAAAQSL